MNRHVSRPAPSGLGRALAALERFLRIEALSGIVLLNAASLAFAWANSPWAGSYHDLWHAPVSIGLGHWVFARPLHFWINDALMTVFFLVVGMEIRHEMHAGALSELRLAALPLAAAVGGVGVPALIYVAINTDAVSRQGWAVPAATDIAFAVGVLALLGRAIPGKIRVFLLALAIIDDIVAVLIIAVFYSGGLDYSGLLIAGAAILMVLGLQRIGVGAAYAYIVPGVVLWLGVLQTGIHPTLAGVVLGLMTPAHSNPPHAAPPPVVRIQAALHPWVAYGVMPLFALANAGVSLQGVNLDAVGAHAVLFGVMLALVVGKPLGVMAASWGVVRIGWCRLPPGVTGSGIGLVGVLAGIGFTMSIFIATLAFSDPNLLASAKLGVLFASLLAAVAGLIYGRVYAQGLRRAKASADQRP